MVNTGKIKGRMRELRLTQGKVAGRMGLSQAAVSQKINNRRALALEEAEKLSAILQINGSQFGDYFFAHEVAKCNK